MICVPIVETTNERAAAALARAAAVADLAELRLDYLQEPPRLEMLLDNRPLPVIVTNRPAREGGLFPGGEAERVALLREAVSLGAEYVDIEHDAVGRLRDRLATRVIVSYHNWNETPENLYDIAQMLLGTGGDIIKVATMVNDFSDNFRLCQLSVATGVPTIVVGMGPKGIASRVLARKFGSFLTFASLSRDQASAPGQLTARELVSVYNFKATGRNTRVYGVIGSPLGHSLSPHIHNAAFRHLGKDSVYVPFEVDDLSAFLAGCKCLDAGGFSVTIPHKEEALRLVPDVDDVTRKIGALNTIRLDGSALSGTNTDWTAALETVKSALPQGETLAGKRALVLGAGGAARAICYGLMSDGAEVVIANRTLARAQALAEELDAAFVPWEKRSEVDYHVLANSTSLGMYPAIDSTPMPKKALRPGAVVFDAVYNPRETRLLREAGEAECLVVDGLEMFARQAAGQLEFWGYPGVPMEYLRQAATLGLDGFDE